MTDLKETLPILDVKVPAVPQTVKAVADLADEYKQAVRDYLGRLDDKKSRIDGLKDQVDAVLKALQDKAAGERPVLEGGMTQVGTAVDQAREALEEGQGELADALDAAGKAMGALQSALQEAAERVGTAQEEAAGSLEGLRGQMTSSESGLDTFVDAAINASDGLETAVEEAKQSAVTGLAELAEKMMTFVEQHVGSRLDQVVARTEALLDKHDDHVTGVLGALDEGCQSVGSKMQERIGEEVSDRVTALVGDAGESYAGLQEAHQQACSTSSDDREQAGVTAAELMGCIQPMNAAVDKVKETARTVNTPWPA